MEWRPAPESLVDLIEFEIDEPCLETRYARLPFYRDGYLVEATTRTDVRQLVFGGALNAICISPLDSRSDRIEAANMMSGLDLKRENVAEYTRFFCRHLRHDPDPFVLVEDLSGHVLVARRQPRGMAVRVGQRRGEDGSFLVGAFFRFRSELLRCTLRVYRDGLIRMLKDRSLGKVRALQ